MNERAIGLMDAYVRGSEQRGMVRYPSDHARRSDGGSFSERALSCAAAGGCVRAGGSVGYDECAPCMCVCVHGSQDQHGDTALIYATLRGDTEIAQALIAGGADANVQVCWLMRAAVVRMACEKDRRAEADDGALVQHDRSIGSLHWCV